MPVFTTCEEVFFVETSADKEGTVSFATVWSLATTATDWHKPGPLDHKIIMWFQFHGSPVPKALVILGLFTPRIFELRECSCCPFFSLRMLDNQSSSMFLGSWGGRWMCLVVTKLQKCRG